MNIVWPVSVGDYNVLSGGRIRPIIKVKNPYSSLNDYKPMSDTIQTYQKTRSIMVLSL